MSQWVRGGGLKTRGEWSSDALAIPTVIILGTIYGLHRIVDPDIFQQIAVGRSILAHPASLGVSSLLYTNPAYPYVEDKWLFSILVAAVEKSFGPDGLMLVQIALPVLFSLACYSLLRVAGAPGAISLAGTSLALVACAFRLEPRPDTLSHSFLAGLVALLLSHLSYRRLLWIVPLVMVLWVNFHGYFLNGLIVLAVATICASVGDATLFGGARSAGQRWIPIRRAVTLFVCGTAACAIHPQGWRALAGPFAQLRLLAEAPVLRGAIQEFGSSLVLLAGMGAMRWILLALTPLVALTVSLSRYGRRVSIRSLCGIVAALPWLSLPPAGLSQWPHRLTFALLVASLFEVAPSMRRRSVFPPLLLIAFTILAIPLIRNLSLLPPFALLLLAPAWSEAVSDLSGAFTRAHFSHRALTVSTAVVLAVLSAWARLADRLPPGAYRAPGWSGWGVEGEKFPSAAADFVSEANCPGPLLNTFDAGGYLLYRLHPARQVFIAGNTSTYPPSFLALYRNDVMGSGRDLDELQRRFGFRTVVLEHSAMDTPSLIYRLFHDPSWALVYLDRASSVFVHRESGSERLIGENAVDLDAAERSSRATLSSRPAMPTALGAARHVFPGLNLGLFLRAAGRPELAMLEADCLWLQTRAEQVALFGAAAAEEARRLPEAVGQLEEASRLYPGSAPLREQLSRALFYRAVARLDEGDRSSARTDLERSMSLTPHEPGPPFALARLAALDGDEKHAKQLLERALREGSDPRLRRRAEDDPLLAPLLDSEQKIQ